MSGMERLLLSPPDVGKLEEEYVLRALRSGWVAPTGPEVTAFEQEVAARTGVAHGVAMSSGTAALHLALLGVGVGPEDVVLVSTMTFVASANAVLYTGAQPAFVDSGPDGNMDPALLEEAILDLRQRGCRVGAVMAVDLLGRVADLHTLGEICRRHEVPLIEDAAESLGSSLGGAPAGSFGRAAIVSFNGNKIMTTSGGGMLLTDDPQLADHARYLSMQAREPVAHYEHRLVGYNYRMSNILAALGRAQLVRLDDMIARRRQIRDSYRSAVEGIQGVSIFQGEGDVSDNCWLTALLVDPDVSSVPAQTLLERLDEQGVEARPLWKPMHRQPLFSDAPAYVNGQSERFFSQGVTLPSGSRHGPEAIDWVCSAVREVVGVST